MEKVLIDGVVHEVNETHPLSNSFKGGETEDDVKKQKEHEIRTHRNWLLGECDWTQSSDVPEEIKKKWLSYRQALRDITTHEKFPLTFNIDEDFPTQPS